MTPWEALRQRALRQPHGLAVVDSQRSWTHAELAGRVLALADAFDRRGLRRASSCLPNGADALATDLALRLIEAVHAPLPPFFTEAQKEHAERSAGLDWRILPGDGGGSEALGLTLRPAAGCAAELALPPKTALVSFTSGTSAAPKGACLAAAQLDRVAAAVLRRFGDGVPRRHLALLPMALLLEQVAGAYAALLSGAVLFLPELGECGLHGAASVDPLQLAQAIDRWQPESCILVPQLLKAWLAAGSASGFPRSLRFVAVGGAPVAARLLAAAEGLGLPVYQGYGLTECGSVLSINAPGANRPGSVGRVLDHVRLEFAADGELLVAGSVFLGYAGSPGSSPLVHRTGDLGYLDGDGYLHLLGRRREVYITAFGRNVAPDWVEGELCGHPLIAQAYVEGEGRASALALILPRSPQCDVGSLRRAVAEVNAGLPDYARVGAFHLLDQPFSASNGQLTGNGRLRREAIRQRQSALLAAAPPILIDTSATELALP